VLYHGAKGEQCKGVAIWDLGGWVHPGGSIVTASSLCGLVRYNWRAHTNSHVGEDAESGQTLSGGGERVGTYTHPGCSSLSPSPPPPFSPPPPPSKPPPPFSPPPPPSPSPSPPPYPPGTTVFDDVVTFNVTFAADCASFNETALQRRLAYLLDVEPARVFLSVACGSVLVSVQIVAPNRPAAEALVQTLSAEVLSSEQAASDALGEEVIQVGLVELGAPLVVPPPEGAPPEGAPPDPGGGGAPAGSRTMLIAVIATLAPLACCVAAAAAFFVLRGQRVRVGRGSMHLTRTSALTPVKFGGSERSGRSGGKSERSGRRSSMLDEVTAAPAPLGTSPSLWRVPRRPEKGREDEPHPSFTPSSLSQYI